MADGSHTLQFLEMFLLHITGKSFGLIQVPYPYPDRCGDSTRLEITIPNSYKGKTVKLAWVFESPTLTTAWGIDHITVEAVIAGVDIRFVDFLTPFWLIKTL